MGDGRQYYGRFSRTALRLVFHGVTTQVIGFGLAVATALTQWYYGLIPQEVSIAAAWIFLVPYLCLVALFFLWAGLQAPVALDSKRQKKIDDLGKQKRGLLDQIKALQASPEERARRDQVRKLLSSLSDKAKELLCRIVLSSSDRRDKRMRPPVPAEVEEIAAACEREDPQLLLREKTGQGNREIWYANPDYKPAMVSFLFHSLPNDQE